MVSIAYLAWGAPFPRPRRPHRAAAWREGAGLAGVMLASVLPPWLLGNSGWPAEPAMASYALLFAALLLAALWLLLRRAPAWRHHDAGVAGWRATLANRGFRHLLLPYFLNAVSVSIPATLALFFIQDRLGAPQWSGHSWPRISPQAPQACRSGLGCRPGSACTRLAPGHGTGGSAAFGLRARRGRYRRLSGGLRGGWLGTRCRSCVAACAAGLPDSCGRAARRLPTASGACWASWRSRYPAWLCPCWRGVVISLVPAGVRRAAMRWRWSTAACPVSASSPPCCACAYRATRDSSMEKPI
ncbi:MFS transporter [Cupriavidus basilensis]